jgi:hypothetical protein
MRGTAERVVFRPSRTLAYCTNSPEAGRRPHRLSACEESEYAIIRLPYFTGAVESHAKKGGELGRAGLPRSVTLRIERSYGSMGESRSRSGTWGRC